MKIITKAIDRKLSANRAAEDADGGAGNVKPPLKLFIPWGSATWLISERDGDIMFGLCDLGFGSPELGCVSLSELMEAKGPFGLTVERDLNWIPSHTLAEYADKARLAGRIVA